jgi:hypothetical protein
MLNKPVVVLVGGPSTRKTSFYNEFTTGCYHYPTTTCNLSITCWDDYGIIIIDTPGQRHYRLPYDYSWEGVFKHADIILDFGNWDPDEIHGEKLTYDPKYMTWSGDNQETMKRLYDYLQERK